MLFDGILSNQSGNRVSAETLLQLDYFSKPIREQTPSPVTVNPVAMETVKEEPPSTAIKSIDEPMEIGVFRAEDYM